MVDIEMAEKNLDYKIQLGDEKDLTLILSLHIL